MASVFVPPAKLQEIEDRITVIDIRPPWEYKKGHLPGAVNIPFEEFRSPTDETPGKLPTPDEFGTLLGEAGISSDDRLVAYDDQFGVYASRFVVTAEIFGHDTERLHLLNGDYTAYRQRHEPSTGISNADPRPYDCECIEDSPLISANDLDAALETDAVIVDTRDPLEYETVHVPGAINFQWQELVDEAERCLKPRSRCREILTDHGIRLNRPVRLYCNTARRLSFVYTVLKEIGHDDVAFYEGGINAWVNRGGAVETI